jgi:hypothetical protein
MASGFCPQCGNVRSGELRYCAKCGFDFWKEAQAQADNAQAPGHQESQAPVPHSTAELPGTEEHPRRRWLAWIGAGVAALFVLAIIGSALGGGQDPVADTGPSATTPTPSPFAGCPEGQTRIGDTNVCVTEPAGTPRPTPRPTPSGPLQADIGETVQITCGDDPCMKVTVSDPGFRNSYCGQYFCDEPQQSGWEYLQVYVKYRSQKDGSTYNEFDWAIYAAGRQLESYAYTSEGPKPTLSSGSLPKGRTAEGWLIYEVPPRGRVVLSYEPNFDGPPVFEVVLRGAN